MAEPLKAADSGPDHVAVLIVDDSAVARAVMAQMIDGTDRFMVAGAVGTVGAAFEFLARVRVDVILLDLHMPGMNGLAVLPDLIIAGRGARVLVASSAVGTAAGETVQALALGAADTLLKPEPGTMSQRFGVALIDKLGRLTDGDNAAPPPVPMAPTVRPRKAAAPKPGGDAYDIVAIGASTGGIHALSQMLREIPASFRLPILITQHLPAPFMRYFAAQIAVLAGRPCDVATDRMRIRPGRVIVAPGDAHMKLVAIGDGAAAIRLIDTPSASGCMPSVDPMFESLAKIFGARALAIVLSGMGRDGTEGAMRVHASGGCVVVQDQASSVVWGMPGSAAAAGIASALLPPDAIGRLAASGRKP